MSWSPTSHAPAKSLGYCILCFHGIWSLFPPHCSCPRLTLISLWSGWWLQFSPQYILCTKLPVRFPFFLFVHSSSDCCKSICMILPLGFRSFSGSSWLKEWVMKTFANLPRSFWPSPCLPLSPICRLLQLTFALRLTWDLFTPAFSRTRQTVLS